MFASVKLNDNILYYKTYSLNRFEKFFNPWLILIEKSLKKNTEDFEKIKVLFSAVKTAFTQQLTHYIEMIEQDPEIKIEFNFDGQVSEQFNTLILAIKALNILDESEQENFFQFESGFYNSGFSSRLKFGFLRDIQSDLNEIKKNVQKHNFAVSYLKYKETLKELKKTQAHVHDNFQDANLFLWSSSAERIAEWDYAKKQLAPHGTLLAHGTKLRRKDPFENLENRSLNHSFIIVNERIIAMAPQGKYLGEGMSGRVKLGQDEQGGVWAIKISKGSGTISKKEADTTNDLGQGLVEFSRNNKCYLTTVYLGITLKEYLKTHPSLTDIERLQLAVNLLKELRDLHQGNRSQNGHCILHGDFSHPNNIVIDSDGKPHFIDFGRSRRLNDLEPIDAFNEVEYEVSKLIQVSFPWILNSRMLNLNPEMKNLGNKASNLPKLIGDLELTIKLMESPEEPGVYLGI